MLAGDPITGLVEALHPIHPEHAGLSPLVAGAIAVAAVVAVALLWPDPRSEPSVGDPRPLESAAGRLTPAQVLTRIVAVALVGIAVAAGRLGSEDELENLAPALVVGVAWPGLLFMSAAGGPVWRWLDPWDGIARALGSDGGREAAPDVRWAVIPALAWAWYLAVYLETLAPRSVGLALGIYSIISVGGALILGRVAWLSRVEVFGLMFGWLARIPRGLLPAWAPPRGAEIVLGALAGGLAFGLIRTSEIWGVLNVVEGATLYATLAMLGSAAAVAALLWILEGWARRGGASGSVVAASVPAVASIALVVALARSRLFTSLQLLPSVATDPFGRGWDPFGIADLPFLLPLEPLPLAAIQFAVLLIGHIAGAIVLGRRVARTERRPGILALAALVVVGVVALMAAPGL